MTALLTPSSFIKQLEELQFTMDIMQSNVKQVQDILNAGQAKLKSLLTVSRSYFVDVSQDSHIKTVPDHCVSEAYVVSRPRLKKSNKSTSKRKEVETTGNYIKKMFEKSENENVNSLVNCEKIIVKYIAISGKEASFLLSRKMINLIQRETNTRISARGEREEVRVVEVSGTSDNVDTALNALNNVITPLGMSDNKKVENVEVLNGPKISIVKLAMVITKKHCQCLLTKIAPHHSCLINIIGEASGVIGQRITINNILEMVGDKSSIEVGHKLIENILAPTVMDPLVHDWISKDILQLVDNGDTKRLVKTALLVSTDIASCIFGCNGCISDTIRNEYGVFIKIYAGGLIEVIGEEFLVEKVMGIINKFVAPRLEDVSDLGESEPLLTVGGKISGRKIVLKAFVLPQNYSASEVRNLIDRIGKKSNTSIRLGEKVIDTGHIVMVSGEEVYVKNAVKRSSQL